MNCRHCQAPLTQQLVDLGSAPPSNAYLQPESLQQPEHWLPLRVLVCNSCWLVQTADFARADDLFTADYAYFSGFSSTWFEHCRTYVQTCLTRGLLQPGHRFIEVAANDGSLLHYVHSEGIECLGIEPTASTAAAARAKGLHIEEVFLGKGTGSDLRARIGPANLIAANNVLAHVPDINDFIQGIAALLHDTGVVTFEFPSLANLLQDIQFDTIYHEHFSYLSLTSVSHILKTNGLHVVDVEPLPVHGGSLRVYAQHQAGNQVPTERVQQTLQAEQARKVNCQDGYRGFQAAVESIKNDLLHFLITQHKEGKRVVGYGGAAKGNTLLNFAGVRPDLISSVVDRNPAKQGRYLPGSRIPIVSEEALRETQPDYILILPWNLRQEIVEQLSYTREWGAKCVTAIPALAIH